MKKNFVDWYIYIACVFAVLYFLDDLAGVLAIKGELESILLYGSLFLVPSGFLACIFGSKAWGGEKYLFLGILLGGIGLILLVLIGLIAF